MGKFLVRVTIIIVAVYMILGYVLAQWGGVNIHENWYISLFELIVVIYCYSEGKYHCKYIKWLALALLLSDTLTRLDFSFNFLSADAANLIPISIFATSIFIIICQAIRHFYRVIKVKRLSNG
jgi:hypothetical protein